MRMVGDNKENLDTFHALLVEVDHDIELRLVFNYKSDEIQSTPATSGAMEVLPFLLLSE